MTEFVPGFIFSGKYFTGRVEVIVAVPHANKLVVQLCLSCGTSFSIWTEEWNLQHVQWGFENGDYFVKEFTGYPPTYYDKPVESGE